MAAVAAAILYADARAGTEYQIGTIEELRAALVRAEPGSVLRLADGEYPVDATLSVPDRITIAGRDATLRATGRWSGAMVILGHRSTLAGLRIIDATDDTGTGFASNRNVVVVASRRPKDRVAAVIRDCDIETDQVFGVGRDEPLGRAIVVQTRNPRDSAGAHVGARVALQLERSKVRAPRSNSIFAANFAAGGRLSVEIQSSQLAGTLSAVGGVSRPDLVTRADTRIRSVDSQYLAADCRGSGWGLFAGSGVAHPGFETAPGADSNQLSVESLNDRITGYRIGIVAVGGRRVGALSGPSSGNIAQLRLRRLTIETCGEGAADLQLSGARLEARAAGNAALSPGDRNRLLVQIVDSVGSGTRANRYLSIDTPAALVEQSIGNQLRFDGSASQFRNRNSGFDPLPAPALFERR